MYIYIFVYLHLCQVTLTLHDRFVRRHSHYCQLEIPLRIIEDSTNSKQSQVLLQLWSHNRAPPDLEIVFQILMVLDN